MEITVDRGGPFGRHHDSISEGSRALSPALVAWGHMPRAAESSPIDGGRRRRRRGAIAFVAAGLFATGIALTGHAAWIHAKAQLAQVLLHAAWMRAQAGDAQAKPWPWADTRPVARLTAPGHDADLLVLAGTSGRTLAFGPGHQDGTAAPGAPGNMVLSGHRDTHFRFLRELARGDELVIEAASGVRYRYRVRSLSVADSRNVRVPRDPPVPTLTLVTCYPFDAIAPGGPLRYVVVATAD